MKKIILGYLVILKELIINFSLALLLLILLPIALIIDLIFNGTSKN